MSDTDVREHAKDIHDQLPASVDVESTEIEERLDTLVNEYQVPLEEARRSVVSHYLDDAGFDRTEFQGGNQELELVDIKTADQWIDVTAKIVELWEPRSDAIAQVGLLGDETGTLKFTSWAKSDLPPLEEDRVYRLGNVVTDEYQGHYSVKLNRTTTIEAVDTDIEVGDNSTATEGALVDIQRGSGLIKRCPAEDCTRVLNNGRCSEHGEAEGEGEFDLRIKGVIDDGDTVREVVFDQAMTEQLTGLSLEEAQEMAMDALDTSVVADKIQTQTLGRYYRVEGPVMGRYLLVNDIEPLEAPPDPAAILVRARSI